jgi:two-component sensor histidine kinase
MNEQHAEPSGRQAMAWGNLPPSVAQVRTQRSRPEQVAIGIVAALLAVGLRYILPLSPIQLPVLTVIVAVAITSTFGGLASGITTAVIGGLLSWYLFFTPFVWDFGPSGMIPLFGFSVTASVIIVTTHLYRRSRERSHLAELAAMQAQTDASNLFAREMAHRLKNALATVQSIAYRTLGNDSPATAKFAGRLKALADTHDLLNEHVERPTAKVSEVVQLALQPFADEQQRVRVECAEARIAAPQAVSLALALHELCTNASKYGALADDAGRVSLKVEDLGSSIRLSWAEHDGPQVQPPAEHGFGTILLKRLCNDTEIAFDPAGFRCSFSLRTD